MPDVHQRKRGHPAEAFPLGPATQDEIVTTNRFILVLRGEMAYTIEGRTVRVKAGTQFLVPAWVRRVWSVPRGGSCEITWCEFEGEGGTVGEPRCFRRALKGSLLAREKQSHLRLLGLWKTSTDAQSWQGLQAECELKSMLARFWEQAAPVPGGHGGQPSRSVHLRVKAMLRWVEDHYHEPNALEALFCESGVSRNYFRILFARSMQCGPHAYIERLRLRQTRYLLRSTDWQLKRIAAEVGYQDPLYFSKLYHRFWKRAPSRER
ncbi:MAG: helix-turn-helix domain-containing protein [Terrimicrobiaceae bacterium]